MSARISGLDVKLGERMLSKHPALTLVGGLGMAVAIAAAGRGDRSRCLAEPLRWRLRGDWPRASTRRHPAHDRGRHAALLCVPREPPALDAAAGQTIRVAIAVAALPAAVAMGWTEIRKAATRPSFPAGEFLVARISPEVESASDDVTPESARGCAAAVADRLPELMRRLQAEPGVVGVTFRSNLPGRAGTVRVDGLPAPSTTPMGHQVRPVGVHPATSSCSARVWRPDHRLQPQTPVRPQPR